MDKQSLATYKFSSPFFFSEHLIVYVCHLLSTNVHGIYLSLSHFVAISHGLAIPAVSVVIRLLSSLVQSQMPLCSHFAVMLQSRPLTARSNALVCGLSFAGILGSNPSGGMDVCLL
jgi:hypothetical protein